MQSRLVDNEAGEDRGAVGLLGEAEPLELRGPSRIEVATKADLVSAAPDLAHGAKLGAEVGTSHRHMWGVVW